MLGWNEHVWFTMSLGYALKSTVLLAVAAVVTLLMRRGSAAARHLVWTAAGVAVLMLPLLTALVPALPVRGVARVLLPPESFVFKTTATATPESALVSLNSVARATARPLPPGRSSSWQILLMLIWVLGSVAAFARMFAACVMAARLRLSAKPFQDHSLDAALSRSLGIQSKVDVLETGPGTMPMTFGVLRPAVFLPCDAAAWTEERRRIVLLHELAHVRRADVATHLAMRAALALCWWNPLAWYAWRDFLKEAERATDDLVLTLGAPAAAYADHLLAIARAMAATPGFAASLAMARRSQLESRLTAILDSRVNRSTPSRAWALAGLLAAMAIVAPLAAVRAQTPAAVPPDVSDAVRSATSQQNPQILEDAAKAADQARQYETERQLLEPAVELRGQVSGSTSVEYGKGLLKLGDLENKRHNETSASDFYSRAVQILGASPDTAQALVYLGIDAMKKANNAQAGSYFQQAQSGDPAHAAVYTALLGATRAREGNMEEAQVLFQNALAAADPKSSDFLTVAELFRPWAGDAREELEARFQEAKTAVIADARAHMPKTAPLHIGAGGATAAPKPLATPQPPYAEPARILKIQGTALISLEIGPDGIPRNIEVLTGPGFGLNEAAADTVSQWRFQPGTKDGQPVTVQATIEVNFRLL